MSVMPGYPAILSNSAGNQESESLISFQRSHTAAHHKPMDTPQSHTPSLNVLPMLNKSLSRRVIHQSPMQFITVRCSPQPHQLYNTGGPQAEITLMRNEKGGKCNHFPCIRKGYGSTVRNDKGGKCNHFPCI